MSQQEPQTSHPESEGRAESAAQAPLRVLIVEDEAIIAMELEIILEDIGVEVLGVAMTAAKAVDLAREHRPDCVTMDINLKGDRDGISAALELHETFGIRVIFVSAYGSPEMRERAKPAQPYGWVQKPIRPGDLIEALAKVGAES